MRQHAHRAEAACSSQRRSPHRPDSEAKRERQPAAWAALRSARRRSHRRAASLSRACRPGSQPRAARSSSPTSTTQARKSTTSTPWTSTDHFLCTFGSNGPTCRGQIAIGATMLIVKGEGRQRPCLIPLAGDDFFGRITLAGDDHRGMPIQALSTRPRCDADPPYTHVSGSTQ
jgi:hypothetical protein